ncbi:Rep family protein [Streptococcus suis]|nr:MULTISPECIES: Rep family protein [Streptococcus]MDN2988017.1 Rep family protein [Streptococcus suis]MDN3007902.1 Rep family protein [Streptococcus suis]MDS1313071.1 Rep family protein [Streptococcus suis]CYY99536.1 Plasmid replication protein [Streptococcus suis]
MENENRTDWTLPRKNLNPKTKQPYKRGRNWWIVVYPESLPENWKEIISTEPVAISPLHDKDVNADGTKKKPHYHIVFNYKGNKSFEQMDEMARALRAPIPERISGLTGAVRYLTHMDNPEKYQYDNTEIQVFGGFDLESCLALSTGDKRQALKEMLGFISDNNINMWIKGGKISFKMFQEALLDYTVSVSLFEPNFEQKSYIKGLYIQSRGGDRSFLTGDKLEKDRDFFLTFSPSMNCLIGGRGTGKSTLIDMLQFVLSQDCDKQSKLEFLCNHANAFVLYVLEDAEYIIEVSLPDVLQENKDNILQYYGQNRENRYGYPYKYNSDSIKEWTRSQYTKVYKVEGKFFKLVDKTRILEKMFDRRYSVNELVRTADGEKITEFISDLMLKNKNLPRPNYGLRTQTLESFEAKLQELDKYRRVRKDSILKIIDDFNQTQVGKLRICYEQIDRWEVPDFESTLFKSNSTLNFSFENYRISKRDVADILYLVYQELGIKGFVNVILKQNIPNRYFILLKNISEENFAKHENKWRNNSEINDSNIPYLKTSIYSLIANSSLLDELKRVLKEHVANERLFLEFNINSKETSQHLDILYKEVSVLSLGQKVVAMLDFLLAYSDYSKDFRPLIIDQPEDNLDNRYIYRHLVQQFRDVKAQRQIILATHNATIVTNSMTDQVVIMESDGAHAWIESQGYVSEKFIKNHIINQLEGGRDSFKHKMSIYETALSE